MVRPTNAALLRRFGWQARPAQRRVVDSWHHRCAALTGTASLLVSALAWQGLPAADSFSLARLPQSILSSDFRGSRSCAHQHQGVRLPTPIRAIASGPRRGKYHRLPRAAEGPAGGTEAGGARGDGESSEGGETAAERKAVTGPISDVEYVFVNAQEGDEQTAIDEEVLRRVNMVSKAQQGRYKVPEGIPDTERGVGALTAAMNQFPTNHEFQAVGKTVDAKEREAFVQSVVGTIEEYAGAVSPEDISVRERLGGRYTSVSVRQSVDNPQQIADVLDRLSKLPRVVMHF